ncbi:putative flavoprotein involved in K+ transport [Lipingzhangella halophila]|uniref:Putative flavoprotein involved in K+ transport n=1 Tax=Lipingzhangella halophila TaxID=1783352 RepID=A0A7W7RGJ5_9ACTN|nr:ArsO family NAD(P)H-dependent flavin-containing monooxygenase [Lipingzhangella halophila]MBB4931490.1 putative flavoprotein involved in K+ transport [Lipingzhangella halophila]
MPTGETLDVVVVGGGQAGLAAGYYLRRSGADFVILDREESPGGAWQHFWESLRMFSPAEHSMLPGWWMPAQEGEPFPTADHVVDYLTAYERRYGLPVRRPVHVREVRPHGNLLAVVTDAGTWHARHVVSATGTWRAPHVPPYPGRDSFAGQQPHTVDYRKPAEFSGQRVLVVGGGNSAAQILAEVSQWAETTWVTRRPPRLLPEDVDGRALFDIATRQAAARREGLHDRGTADLGDIVQTPPVRAARDRGVLRAEPMFDRLTPHGAEWPDDRFREFDAVIWCTGFRPVLDHLSPLGVADEAGRVTTDGTRCRTEPRLHLLGYGNWTGFASATLIGAGRTAKAAVGQIASR